MNATTLTSTVERIKDEIRQRMGACPSYFLIATDSPQTMEDFWCQAQDAYLDNPLPSLFKEKLFSYFSRFCDISYCMARHCAFLLGHVHAGEASCEPLPIDEVLDLVQRPLPTADELRQHLDLLSAHEPVKTWPTGGSELESSLLVCTVPVFLRRGDYPRCQAELRRVLGTTWYDRLIKLLVFVRSAHFWTEACPELALESDVEQLLREHQVLAEWIETYPDVVKEELAQFGDELSQLTALHSALEESERRYRRLTYAVTDYIYRVRVEAGRAVETIHAANCEAVTGYRPEEFAANPMLWIAMVPLEDRAIVEQQAARILSNQDPPPIEHRIQRKDGAIRWVLNTVSPQHGNQGQLIAFDGLLRDITEQKQAEQALQHLNETLEQRIAERTGELRRLAKVFTDSSEAILINDLTGRVTEANAAVEQHYGWTRDELIGRSIKVLVPPEEHEQRDELMARCLRGEEVRSVELSRVTKDGKVLPVSLTLSLLTDDNRQPTGIATFSEDISRRKAAEEELRTKEYAIQSAITGVTFASLDGEITYANPAFAKMFGYDHESEVVGHAKKDLASDASVIDEIMNSVRTRGYWHGEDIAKKRDGTLFPIELAVTLMRDANGKPLGLVATFIDISQRKQAEAMQTSLGRILEESLNEIYIFDAESFKFLLVNRGARENLGYTMDELRALTPLDLKPRQTRQRFAALLATLRSDEREMIRLDTVHLRKNRSQYEVEVQLQLTTYQDSPAFVAIIRDTTQRNELQREVLEIAAEVDRRIGHELHDNIQQQLTGLGLLAVSLAESLTDQSLPEATMAERLADGIKQSAEHVHLLSRGLVPVEVDAEGLRAALTDLASRISQQYSVHCDFCCAGPVGVADNFVATHLYRIAQEAVNNAIKHGRAGRIDISLTAVNSGITLKVLDNGIGIGDKRASGPGTGLRIMDYRAGLIGATVQVAAGENGGTLVECTVLPTGR